MPQLRQSTSTLDTIPPPSDTNGATVTNLTSMVGILSKNGATSIATFSLTNNANSGYNVLIGSGTSDTAGRLMFTATNSTAYVPYFFVRDVLSGSAYDFLYAGGTVTANVTNGVTVTTNNDKTGYSLTQSFPANFSSFSIDTFGRAMLTDGEHNLIWQETHDMPGATPRFIATNGVNTLTNAVNAGIRNPWADPYYAALHGGSNQVGVYGSGWFDIGDNSVTSPDGMSWIGPPAWGMGVISSTRDEPFNGCIFKPGSNSFVNNVVVYGSGASQGSGFQAPFGYIAKNGTNGQSIANNVTFNHCYGYTLEGADVYHFQTKNADLTPSRITMNGCGGDSQFDTINGGLSNIGGNWPFRLDINGGRFTSIDAGAGWTVGRTIVHGVGQLNMQGVQIVASSTQSSQVTLCGLNVRPQNSSFPAIANLQDVSFMTSGTASTIAADILGGQTPSVGTGGANVFTAASSYRTTSGAPVTPLPVNTVNTGTNQTTLAPSQNFNNPGQTTALPANTGTNPVSLGTNIVSTGTNPVLLTLSQINAGSTIGPQLAAAATNTGGTTTIRNISVINRDISATDD